MSTPTRPTSVRITSASPARATPSTWTRSRAIGPPSPICYRHAMKFNFSTEQEEFRSNLRRLLAERSPSKEVRRLMETEAGWERDGWRKLNSELGLTALRIPEAYDGQGFGFVELGIVLEEMGRALVCAPYFSSVVLATSAILNGADEAQKQALLPGLAAGDTVAALAFTEANGQWDQDGIETTAHPAAGRYRLSGVKSFVKI